MHFHCPKIRFAIQRPELTECRVPAYTYDELPTNSIRLLRVLPELVCGHLQCELHITSVNTTKYTALSYTWGPATDDKAIIVNGRLLQTRRNLWDFLMIARYDFAKQYLWIDAICINQQDLIERNQQVNMMASIYRNAQSTIMWLGELVNPLHSKRTGEWFGSRPQMKLHCINPRLKRIRDHWQALDLSRSYSWLEQPGTAPRYPRGAIKGFSFVVGLLIRMSAHPYWTRLWIIQEAMLSSNKSLIFEGQIMSYELVSQFVVHFSYVRDIMKGSLERFWWRNAFAFIVDAGWGYACTRGKLKFMVCRLISDTEGEIEERSLPKWLALLRPLYFCFQDLVPHNVILSAYCRLNVDDQVRQLDELVLPGYPWTRTSSSSFLNRTLAIEQLDTDLPLNRTDACLKDIFRSFNRRRCQDRRDKIYGLHALIGKLLNVNVNYEVDVYQLFFEVIHSYSKRFHNNEFDTGFACRMLVQMDLGLLDLIFGLKLKTCLVDQDPSGMSCRDCARCLWDPWSLYTALDGPRTLKAILCVCQFIKLEPIRSDAERHVFVEVNYDADGNGKSASVERDGDGHGSNPVRFYTPLMFVMLDSDQDFRGSRPLWFRPWQTIPDSEFMIFFKQHIHPQTVLQRKNYSLACLKSLGLEDTARDNFIAALAHEGFYLEDDV